jgi:xylulokinase
MEQTLIGIDVGTTSVKASLLDTRGTVLKGFADRYPTAHPRPGHVEQNPEDWTRLVHHALEQLKDPSVAAIGLCSQVNTHVFVDDKGAALLPAMTWQDGRCALEAAVLDAQVSIEGKLKWWGAPLPIDASHVLARMAYVAKHHPDIWRKTRWVMAPKDYCIYHLTGAVAADPMTCFGIVDQNLNIISELIDLVPGAAKRLPPIAGFTEIAGRTNTGIQVVTSAMDAWSGLLGAGVCENGQAVYLSGTSEILGIISEEKVPTPGVIAFAKCEGIVLHAGPTQSGAASADWAARLLNTTPAEISAMASSADLSCVPLFLPHLDGERAPLWDANSRGSFAGLTSASASPELARAVLEGVGYAANLLLQNLETSSNTKPDIIHHAGGGASSDIWCQIRADILGRTINRTSSRDAGVLGAALMAGVGAKLFPSLRTAARSLVQFDRTFEPDEAQQQRHATRFEGYKKLYEQLRPVNTMLQQPRT